MYQHYPELNMLSSSYMQCVSGFTTMGAGDMRKIQTIKDYFEQRDISPRKIVILEQIQ